MPWTLKLSNWLGACAEKQALLYLKRQGLRLLHANFACKAGELDLVMLDQSTLVFIEVRARSNAVFGSAASSIDRHKQRRIRKTAAVYLHQFRQHNHRICRFDTVCIEHHDGRRKNRLNWLKNAF